MKEYFSSGSLCMENAVFSHRQKHLVGQGMDLRPERHLSVIVTAAEMETVARMHRALSQKLDVNTSRNPGTPAPVVHPQASLKGKVTLKAGCCIGAASVVDGGEGGIVIGDNTVLESRVTLTNTRPAPMVIGRYSWMEDFSSVKDVPRIGNFVRVESSAKVNNCEELGTGTTVAAGAVVENRGVVSPHSVLYGELGTLAHDDSGIVHQAGIAAANLSKASP